MSSSQFVTSTHVSAHECELNEPSSRQQSPAKSSNIALPAKPEKLENIVSGFNQLFSNTFDTILVGGADEPLYQPRLSLEAKHTIRFTRDYVSSALHEMAHWCIAGEVRRKRLDYGYWYAPDGRNAQQQIEFERVEVKPQALEWILSVACGVVFRISADNLVEDCRSSPQFKYAVHSQVQLFLSLGLPKRAQTLAAYYANHFGTQPFSVSAYHIESLELKRCF